MNQDLRASDASIQQHLFAAIRRRVAGASAARRRACIACLTASAALLVGCANGPKTPVPRYTQIEVIPITSPTDVYTQNRLVPLPVLPVLVASSIANRMKSNEFVTRMRGAIDGLGPELTAMVVEELQAQGMRAEPFDRFTRSSKAPDDIDYLKLPTQHAVLHIWFSDVSMDSPRTSSYYLPRVNIDLAFYPKLDPSYAHAQYLRYHYGTDAGEDKGHGRDIQSHDKYRFADFDALLNRSDDVQESWRAGLREIARRIARDIHKPGQGG